MAKYWRLKFTSVTSAVSPNTVVANSIIYPFKWGGNIYNINNLPNTEFGIAGNVQLTNAYLKPAQTRISSYIARTQYGTQFYGYPQILRTENDTQPFTQCVFLSDETTISGKFRFKSNLSTLNTDLTEGTVSVNYTINGENYNAFVFPYDNINFYHTRNQYPGYTTGSYNVGGFKDLPEFSDSSITHTPTTTLFNSSLNSSSISQNLVGEIIDFGNLPQKVPQKFVDWLYDNLEYIYPYKYTVKSPDGVTLAEQGELPPIRNITLSTMGNNVSMILTGSNGANYTLTWSHTVPEGKTFLGLGYAATDKRASIPSGTTTAVTWDSDITVYEIYGKYVPPATTFTITLYQNTAENNRVDKTNYLTSVGSINGTLRSECSILRPSIIIAQDSLPTFNYVYIPIFSRYYFVTGITSVNFGLWRIELNTDVLMTYQTGVKALMAIIARQENDYNDDLIDTEIPTEKEPTITYQEIVNGVLNTQETADNHSFVVTVVGA